MTGETLTTVIGNLTADPEIKYAPSGDAVTSFTIAATPRRYDKSTGQWVDSDTLFIRCSTWRRVAEHAAESLQRGTRVIAHGSLQQRNFESRDGEKRTVIELAVDEVGPSLRYATTKVTRPVHSSQAAGDDQMCRPAAETANPRQPTDSCPMIGDRPAGSSSCPSPGLTRSPT